MLGDAHTPSDEQWWNTSSDGSDETATRALLRHGADASRVDRYGHDERYYAEQYLDHLRAEAEEESSAEEADEETLA